LLASGALWLGVLGREWLQLRRSGRKWAIGFLPLGGTALTLAILWIAVVVLSLVDFQRGGKLFMNVALLDQGYRVSWTEAVLRTGIPPANPHYWLKHPSTMRNYYFWYVVCAAVSQLARLSARGVFIASSIWAGFGLVALNGLYLKHFLQAGTRLRKQFLRSVVLLMVTGLNILVTLWSLYYLHHAPFDLVQWAKDPILSWLHTLLWAPHHIASLVCCMLAFLLAWKAGTGRDHRYAASVALIAAALASAFGLSVYVTFAFFLVMLIWAVWQVVMERTPRPALVLAAGGAGALVLLVPYLWELTHASSKMHGSTVFAFAVREMIPPGDLLASPLLQHLAIGHPITALNLAKLVLLAPGYALELGFYFAVLLIYLVPAWRGRTTLTPAQRSLLFIAAATIPLISLVRSSVLDVNDFGWRSALLLQFPLLLLGSEVMTGWSLAEHKSTVPADFTGLPHHTPHWLRSIAALALVLGGFGTLYTALWLRFALPLIENAHVRLVHDAKIDSFSHNAYISSIGYAQLNASIPRGAIVQFNPYHPNPYWTAADLLGVDHQSVIVGDQPSCGAELGGDPSGCPAMAAAIDAVYNGATADQARATCRQYGIQYLVARIYDPAWNDRNGWVWTLRPVVSDEEFRVLDCRP